MFKRLVASSLYPVAFLAILAVSAQGSFAAAQDAPVSGKTTDAAAQKADSDCALSNTTSAKSADDATCPAPNTPSPQPIVVAVPAFLPASSQPIEILRPAMFASAPATTATPPATAAPTNATPLPGPVEPPQLLTLSGNVRSAANSSNDRGALRLAYVLNHLLLQLKRTPQQEQAFTNYVAELTTKGSPNFHKWLTLEEIQRTFGPTPDEVVRATTWLRDSGFTVNQVSASGTLVDFSGNAGIVQNAFHTSMHNLSVNGVAHIANMQDPQIPAALGDIIEGVVSLNDFHPHALNKNVVRAHVDPRTQNILAGSAIRPDYTFTPGDTTYHAVVPGDLATIYNLTPLFSSGISGQGQTIALVEDSDIFNAADWTAFRKAFGLSSYPGTLSQIHPGSNCTDPGTNADDKEAIMDAEYASAAAPSATIVVASCANTSTSFGGLIAFQNLIAQPNPPQIISISYGECETENGATANAAYFSAYQTAVAEGISVFASTGDEGAAGCDVAQTSATHGIAVSGMASTPYNVAVGGTDFGDTDAGTTATYWNATNTATYASAHSYVPEITWNDSCASQLLATYSGSTTTYGSFGFCNFGTGKEDYLSTSSSSGGPSGCATGTASIAGVVSGTCAGYAKPSWQSLIGVPSDSVRDIPDVSLFAANGVWGHYFVYCDSDTQNGGASCAGSPETWSGGGGTSFASPIMAAIQALVDQKTGSLQGNPNPAYYALAAQEYGSEGSQPCNATLGNAIGSSCIFHDVTKGDMDVVCTGTINCYHPSGVNGALSNSNTAYDPAYTSNTGWDFATGIGSINAYNLATRWQSW
jgi:subtilase family serine protease